MTPGHRAFDLCLGIMLAACLAAPFLLVLVVHMAVMGRPYFHKSERMRSPVQSFGLWKLRSMRNVADFAGVTGGDKAARIPRWGRILRASRLDEVPQLWNVLRGEMRLVGPRPPLRVYVERFPALYAAVLQMPPGITGLATLAYHRHERRLLAPCRTAAETDAVYARRCVPRKARMDRIYQRHQNARLDLLILFWTVVALSAGRCRRLPRLRQPGRQRPLARMAGGASRPVAHAGRQA